MARLSPDTRRLDTGDPGDPALLQPRHRSASRRLPRLPDGRRGRLAAAGCVAAVALLGGTVGPGVGSRRPESLVGRSAQGRTIRVVARGDPGARYRILVVGCIHGDECAGIAVARWLEHAKPARSTRLWILENLNPDGFAARTRQNGRGVDLNRNFPWRWQAAGRPGDRHYAGTHALSEPESRFAARLIEQVRPQLTIWFHQPLGVVDAAGGRRALERRYARLVGLPLQRLPSYPGSVAGWQSHLYPTTSFVVELPAGPLTRARAARFGDGILDLLGPA